MDKVKFSEIHKILSSVDKSQLPKLHIAILRNVMIEPLEPYLKYFGYQMGFDVNVKFGEYDNIFQEAVDGQGDLIHGDLDVVMVFMKMENLSWALSRNFVQLKNEQILEEKARLEGHISNILMGIRQKTNAAILFQGFEQPINPAYGILDSHLPNGQAAVVRDLNLFLIKKLAEVSNAYFIDMNLCLSRVGAAGFYDQRYWHIGRAPYTREGLREIAYENLKYIRFLKNNHKKCLVLDCDNVLWGGIIGEDGINEIKLGRDYPGSPYYEFQQEILNYHHRGIILALCSKNNAEDVWEVFDKHPDMLLKKKHIASAQINWDDKVANIKKIAQDLNIGLDSLVFVDDSPFEINLVREMLPEVECIALDADQPATYRDVIASCGYFDVLEISEEDKKRGSMYKAEAERKKMQTEITDINAYYQSLEMIITYSLADDFTIPRIAQLTQKTNQFNLTTVRYKNEDIQAFSQSTDVDVIALKLSDKFGDSGLVGVAIIKYKGDTAHIDTLLLSCRVLGRGVEKAFMIQILKLCEKRGVSCVTAQYIPTKKNGQVAKFYPDHGFDLLEKNGETCSYRYELCKGIEKEPDYFTINGIND